MARDGIRFTVTGTRDIEQAARALRRVPGRTSAGLRDSLRRSARPLAAKARAKVRALPTKGRGSTGLRRRVARGVEVSATTDRPPRVQIRVRMRQRDERNLPRYMDKRDTWRHPVFGNRSVWVTQKSPRGDWFLETMRRGERDIRAEISEVLEDVAERTARDAS